MRKYRVKIYGQAQVAAYTEVEAESEAEAIAKSQDPDVLMEVDWKYAEIEEVLFAEVVGWKETKCLQ